MITDLNRGKDNGSFTEEWEVKDWVHKVNKIVDNKGNLRDLEDILSSPI